jgi:UDP-N-acetylglucosamine--N-acetylmuramyl-(pentapeptide) pyrophosphoryl-undecaprenol N-acetylglucosamine transferase
LEIVLAIGSTGGHIYPALAVALKLKSRIKNIEIIFMGPKRELPIRVINKEDYPYVKIESYPFRRILSPKEIFNLFYKSFKGFKDSYLSLRYIKPRLVVGFGSYTCGPVLLASYLLNIPTIIHEQNVAPGITNRVFAYLAKKVCVSYPKNSYFRKKKNKIIFTGNPVKEKKDISKKEALGLFNLNEGRFTIFVFGGSQGSKRINEVIVEFILSKEFKDYPFQIIFVTGDNFYKEIKERLKAIEKVSIIPYLYDISSAYSAADIVISRAGACSISEITLWGLPSILIPYPYAAYKHQEKNAFYLKENMAAEVILEEDLNKERLANTLIELYSNPAKLEEMRKNSKSLSNPKASENMVEVIMRVLKGEDYV